MFSGLAQQDIRVGRAIAGAYLRAGFGGVITVANQRTLQCGSATAPSTGAPHRHSLTEDEGFNFVAYELARQGGFDGIAAHGVSDACLESAKRTSPTASHRAEDSFWIDSCRQVLRYSIPLLFGDRKRLHWRPIRFITPLRRIAKKSSMQLQTFFLHVRSHTTAATAEECRCRSTALRRRDYVLGGAIRAMPDRTRGNVAATVTCTLDRFMHGRLNRAFCGRTTLVPELTFPADNSAGNANLNVGSGWRHCPAVIQIHVQNAFSAETAFRKNTVSARFYVSDEAQETVSPMTANSLDVPRLESLRNLSHPVTSGLLREIGGRNPRDAAHNLVGKL